MDKDKWIKIEALVDGALANPVNKRVEFIKSACYHDPALEREALKFLEYITKSEGWLEDSRSYQKAVFRNLSEEMRHLSNTDSFIGTQVGAYTIIKEIAKGGMGTVYMAKRTDGVFEHQVAIKMINGDCVTRENVERFKQERNILAELNHSGIAHIYDGGITQSGIPYFVMEYVDGIPVTQYCNTNNLSLSDRLNLFKQILKAVQHAHENLVIHRDLKPANILVNAEGEIKILDFGISKLISETSKSETIREQKQILTLKYASPEQIRNETVTTASDFYGLGLILYQLLADNLPYHLEAKTVNEVEYKILHSAPIPPSQNVSPLSSIPKNKIGRELDAIILKSIEKEPAHRYRSASAFLNDLIKFEKNRPVSACEDTLLYRIKKIIARNKIGVSAATFILILSFSFSIFYTLRITEQKNQAQNAANKAEEIADFLIHLFEASDPANNLGNTFTTQELLQNGIEQAKKLSNQPLMQARFFDITGQVYRNIGMYDEAKMQINKAIQLRKQQLGENHPLTLSSRHNLGLVLNDMGDFEQAASVFETVYENRKQLFGEHSIEVASTQAFWAFSIRRQGDYERAEKMARKSLEIFKEQLEPTHFQTLDNMNKLAMTLQNKGEYEEAEELYVDVLKLRREKLGAIHPQVAKSTNNLATLYLNTGRFNEARELMEEALRIHKELFGPFHPNVAQVTNNLGLVFIELGEYEKAETKFRKALDMRNELLGPNHTNTAISIFSLAKVMLETNQPDSALSFYNQAYQIFSKELSPEHSFAAHSKLGIGRALAQKKQYAEAEQYYSEGFEQIKRIHQQNSIERAMATYHVGVFYLSTGNTNQGHSLINSSLEALKNIEGKNGIRQKKVAQSLVHLSLK